MKRFYLLVLCVVIFNVLSAQNPDETMSYKVTNFVFNGEVFDQAALENDIALTFYYSKDGDLCFSNHWRKTESQSYGPVYSLKTTESPETKNEYAVTQFKFTWYYFNTYDNDSGEAVVTIKNIHIGNSIKFVAEIIPLDTNDVLSLRGYLE